MVDPLTLLAFIPAALALNLTPGADMTFCLSQGLRSGPRTAIASSAGISAGSMVHVAIAGVGLGALVGTHPWLFDVIRWIGVGYLLWLAYGALRHSTAPPELRAVPMRAAFWSGLLVNLTNPKVILFVLAFIPQFVVPEAGSILGQFFVYGAILGLGGFVINAGVGIFAGGVGRALTESPRASRMLGYVTGTLFAALALRLAIMERS